jgi:large subunit ribosomal protein L29
MKAKAYAELSDDELDQQHRDRLKERLDLTVKKASGKLDNPLRLRLLRREIARIKTVAAGRRQQRKEGKHG